VSVFVRYRRQRWEVVSDLDDREAVLFSNVARFRAVDYAARLLDVSSSEVVVRE
jgi:hypothetical protein